MTNLKWLRKFIGEQGGHSDFQHYRNLYKQGPTYKVSCYSDGFSYDDEKRQAIVDLLNKDDRVKKAYLSRESEGCGGLSGPHINVMFKE